MRWIKKVAETPLTTIANVIDSLQAQANDRTNAPSIYSVRNGLNNVSDDLEDAKTELSGDIQDTNAALGETNTTLTQTNTALNQTIATLEQTRTALNNVWSSIYPVGSIYINVNDIDPATLFGGTWERIQDKFLLASGSSYTTGRDGGSMVTHITPTGTIEGHALTVAELPQHIHPYAPYYPADSGLMADFYRVQSGTDVSIPKIKKNMEDQDGWTFDNIFYQTMNPAKTEYTQNAAHSHIFTGTDQTINTMPRYLAVNVWYRTA